MKHLLTIGTSFYLQKIMILKNEEIRLTFTDNKEAGVISFNSTEAAEDFKEKYSLNGLIVVNEIID